MATSTSFPPVQYHAGIERLSCALNKQTDNCNTNSAQADIAFSHKTQQNKTDAIQFQNNLIIGTKIKQKPTTDHRTRVLLDTCKVEPRLFHYCHTFTKFCITKLNDAT